MINYTQIAVISLMLTVAITIIFHIWNMVDEIRINPQYLKWRGWKDMFDLDK